MKINIAIISYNRLNLLKDCMESLFDCTRTPFSLTIIDNASTDEGVHSFLKVLEAKHKFIKVIKNKENEGCGPTRFKLMNKSNSDIFIFLDSDMVLTPDWEKALIDELVNKPHLGAVGPLIVNPNNIVHSNGGCLEFINSKYICLYERDCGADLQSDGPFFSAACEWLPGGAVALRGNVARGLIRGGHETYFKFGFNDAHISLMLKARGYNLGTRCDSIVYHIRDNISIEEKERYYANRENLSTLCISIMQFVKVHNFNPCFSWKLLDRLTGKTDSTVSDAEIFFGGLKKEFIKKKINICSDFAEELLDSYINQYRKNTATFESTRDCATAAGLNRNWRSAVELWEHIDKTFPGRTPYAKVKRAQALRHLGKFEEAKSILFDEKKRNRVPVYVRAELAELAMAQEQWALAVRIWSDLEQHFPGQWKDLPHRLSASLAKLDS